MWHGHQRNHTVWLKTRAREADLEQQKRENAILAATLLEDRSQDHPNPVDESLGLNSLSIIEGGESSLAKFECSCSVVYTFQKTI